MRIQKIEINGYKNLKDLIVELDGTWPSIIFLGLNGSGKSNLIEALAQLFSDIWLGRPTSFDYTLSYSLGESVVVLRNDTSACVRQISLNGSDFENLNSIKNAKNLSHCLPVNVFSYYSGLSDRLESIYRPHEDNFRKKIRANDGSAEFRPLFYARHFHGSFVLLSSLCDRTSEARKLLTDDLGIEGIDSALFVLREPDKELNEQMDSEEILWNAVGSYTGILKLLYVNALAPLKISHPARVNGINKRSVEHQYFFISDQEKLQYLVSQYGSERAFFKAIETAFMSGLLVDIRIKVKVRDIDGFVSLRELSEGELQLLSVWGLVRYSEERSCLFLLDEPDTHLNPMWSSRYIRNLEKALEGGEKSQLLMTTHDPIVIGELSREQVRILKRDPVCGSVQSMKPADEPYELGYPGILMSEMFGLESVLSNRVEGLLDRKRNLAIKTKLSDKDKAELKELNSQLKHIDLTNRVRDPLFSEYVKIRTELGLSRLSLSGNISAKEKRTRQAKLKKIINALEGKE